MNPFDIYPLPVLILDYLLGVTMWTLLARSVIDLFFSQQNEMVIVVSFRKITTPVINLFTKITPRFLVHFLVPAYVAWFFYLVRFYLLPYLFFGEFGVLSFPLEGAISQLLLSLG